MALHLGTDPWSGQVDTFEYDEGEDRVIIKSSCDVSAVLDRNKELANHTTGWTEGRTMRHAARIPVTLALKWRLELGIDVYKAEHWPAVKKLLNDPEWRYLRTANFRL